MTAKRAAAYSGGGLLLLAWLASAAGLAVRQPQPQPEPAPAADVPSTTALAEDVHAQTERLRTRLASAPSPRPSTRNPFTFASRTPAARPAARDEGLVVATEEPLLPAEPAIELVGVAEDLQEGKTVRTAIIATLSGDTFLVKEGESIAGRYRVSTVSADAVILSDLATGGERRLTLRN
jgi:hypothetical protein